MRDEVESGAYYQTEAEARAYESRHIEEQDFEALISSLNPRQLRVFQLVFAELTSPSIR